jgi:hypothetical protein
MKKSILLALVLVICWAGTAYPQVITTAGLELQNTFQKLQIFVAGIQLNGANSGAVTMIASPTSSTYSIQWPSSAPQPNQILVGGLVPGTLAWSVACGGFSPGGDLSGNSTSQTVVGLNGINLNLTVQPQDGWVLKYNAASNSWIPSVE